MTFPDREPFSPCECPFHELTFPRNSGDDLQLRVLMFLTVHVIDVFLKCYDWMDSGLRVLLQAGLIHCISAQTSKFPVAPLSNGKKRGPRSTKGLLRVCDTSSLVSRNSKLFFRPLCPYVGDP